MQRLRARVALSCAYVTSVPPAASAQHSKERCILRKSLKKINSYNNDIYTVILIDFFTRVQKIK